MVRPRLAVGDVFVIPLGDGRAGVGQIVGAYGKDAFYFAVFDGVLPLAEVKGRAIEFLGRRVRFLALSLDAKLYVGHWTIVGHVPVAASFPLPAYKEAVGAPPGYEVVDFSGTLRRPATPAEAAKLPNRKVVAPVRLERALKAAEGLEPWHEAFDELRFHKFVTTADMFD